jgi:hypothetical protein
MQLVDRIEKRRFVGRELLLWLWFESEVFEGTLATKEHGSFGFYVQGQIVLSAGKEATRIKGQQPASGREAKEAVRLGKLPESAGFHLLLDARESTFTLKAEQLAVGGLRLATVLGAAEEAPPDALLKGPRPPPRRKRESVEQEQRRESDEEHEVFYERMQLTRDFEVVLEALYRDFLTLRLGNGWDAVTSAMRTWAAGEEVDADAYREERDRWLARTKKRKTG